MLVALIFSVLSVSVEITATSEARVLLWRLQLKRLRQIIIDIDKHNIDFGIKNLRL